MEASFEVTTTRPAFPDRLVAYYRAPADQAGLRIRSSACLARNSPHKQREYTQRVPPNEWCLQIGTVFSKHCIKEVIPVLTVSTLQNPPDVELAVPQSKIHARTETLDDSRNQHCTEA